MQTLAFFNRNLVMEYSRQRAIADGVNVDGVVYEIRTRITEEGSTVEAGNVVKRRERKTRAERWEQLDEDLSYDAGQLDRAVVAEDQIRTVVRTWRDRLFSEIFPGRSHIPKTIVFAKDDSHAEAIVRIMREEFDKGNDFCQKITYRVTGVSTDDLISAFRNSYHPRIAVTVDTPALAPERSAGASVISTGTDIKPVECLLFMRLVKSRTLFEQMVGRGTRVIDANDLLAVTPDAGHKDHFVIVDAVGIVDQPKLDPEPLERQPSLPFARLLERVALGVVDEDTLSSLAGRLARLRGKLSEQDGYRIAATSGGLSLPQIIHRLLDAVDPDAAGQRAEERGIDATAAAAELMEEAARLFDSAELRQTLLEIQARDEQTVDVVSLDQIREARFSDDATAQALATVASFQQFIQEHRDQIAALEIIYGQPRGQRRLHAQQLAELVEQMRLPPHAWTTEGLWRAYAQLERDRVRGVRTQRVLTDLVSLVRHAVQLDDELAPYPERVQQRYSKWLAGQEQAGRAFTPEQHWWLDRIAEHIGVNLEVAPEDLDYGEFFNRGGRLGAQRALGADWLALVDAMNEALVV